MKTATKSATDENAYRRLIEIGIALSAEKNLDSLLEHILLEAKSMANADAGSVYLNTGKGALKFTLVINDSLSIVQGGKSGEQITLPEIPLKTEEGEPNLSNIATACANQGRTIVVDDAKNSKDFKFSGTKEIDALLGYQSTSFLTIPLKGIHDNCIGVLQLINAKNDSEEVASFREDVIPLIEALASQAAISIENRTLQDEQEELKKQLEKEVDNRTEELKEALTKLSEAHIILKEMNTIDAVTGVRNRQYFDDVLEQEWRRARRQRYDISLMLLDIDFFKKVNDTYGHLAGDECLAAVAKEIDDMFNRPSDVVARYGGEEFAIVLPYVSAENAKGLAEQLRKLIADKKFQADGNEISITVSIGLATILPDDEIAPRDLIGRADNLLYEAKAGGRDQVRQYQTG